MGGFQVLSIAAIIRRERHDSPMTDEERQRAMDFIVAQQAKHSVEIDRLLESHRRAEHRLALTDNRLDRDEHRLDRDERILKLMIKAGRRARQDMREQHARVAEEMAEMREFQAHSDKRLDALIDIVRADRNGPSA
jgi:hypothetical protein